MSEPLQYQSRNDRRLKIIDGQIKVHKRIAIACGIVFVCSVAALSFCWHSRYVHSLMTLFFISFGSGSLLLVETRMFYLFCYYWREEANGHDAWGDDIKKEREANSK